MTLRHRGRRVFTIDQALSGPECNTFIQATETTGYTHAPITTARGFLMCPEVRNNTRVMVDDHAHARWLWERVRPTIPAQLRGMTAVGLNERFRYYRYQPGQYFQWHYDGAYRRSRHECSLLTLMVYLSDDFTGGHTEFDPGDPVHPRQGMALVFDHGIRHRGAPVDTGTKYVMRTDVMYRDLAAAAAATS